MPLRGLPRLLVAILVVGTMRIMLRIFVASVALVAITIVLLLHATHHGAHANSPTHCGFWAEIEAGLSCR